MSRIYIVAGEQSGDSLGARLMEALKAARPGIVFVGVGGPMMAEQGLASLFPIRELAVMGLLEVLPRLLRLRRLLGEVVADIERQRPDLLITIDSPGFTLRVLARVAPTGLRRVHYVAPQVWAWREHRVQRYPGLWDKLLCLLPFEPAFFARHGLQARFVGHPVLESGAGSGDGRRFRERHGLSADARLLILMPGSRKGEVSRLLPVFEATLALLANSIPGLVPVVPVAPIVAGLVREATGSWPAVPIVVTDLDDKHDAYAAAAAALTKSGTSTLELALAGVPMAVTYRVNAMTAAIARRMVRVKYAALVNLLAGRLVVPELIQDDCTPVKLAREIAALLTDGQAVAAQRAEFGSVLASLAAPHGTPSAAAAAEVLDLLDSARPRSDRA